jgi:hypothetical protein
MNSNQITKFMNHVAVLKFSSSCVVFNRYEVPIARTERMPPEFALQVASLRFPDEEDVLRIKPWNECTMDQQRAASKRSIPLLGLQTACSLIRLGVLEVPERYVLLRLHGLKAETISRPNTIGKEAWNRAVARRAKVSHKPFGSFDVSQSRDTRDSSSTIAGRASSAGRREDI